MKRLVTAVVLLSLIVTVSVFSLFVLERDLGEVSRAAGALREAEPSPALEEQSRELLRLWNEKEALLVIFLRHDALDEVTLLIARLPGLARSGEYGLFYSGLDGLLARLEDLLDAARPSYRNLL